MLLQRRRAGSRSLLGRQLLVWRLLLGSAALCLFVDLSILSICLVLSVHERPVQLRSFATASTLLPAPARVSLSPAPLRFLSPSARRRVRAFRALRCAAPLVCVSCRPFCCPRVPWLAAQWMRSTALPKMSTAFASAVRRPSRVRCSAARAARRRRIAPGAPEAAPASLILQRVPSHGYDTTACAG